MPYFMGALSRRGSQVVRQGSAKALCVGSIPTLASITLLYSPKLASNSLVTYLTHAPIRMHVSYILSLPAAQRRLFTRFAGG